MKAPNLLLSFVILFVSANVQAQTEEELQAALYASYEMLDAGDVDGAELGFDTLADLLPGSGAPLAGLAAVSAARGDWNAVVVYARDAASADPSIPLAQTLLCRGLVVQGDLRGAVAPCVRAIELDPTDPTAYRALCASYVARYRWSEAETYCEAGVELDPRDADLRWRYGVALTHLGSLDAAAAQCDAAVEAAPSQAMAHYCVGALQLERGDDGAALAACESAVAADGDHALGHYCRGMAHLGLGNVPEADRDCNRAVSLAPREALGHFCLGRIAREAGRPEEAVRYLTDALELNDQLLEARGSLGDVLTRSGSPEDGEPWLRDALQRAPSADRYAQLGYNLYLQGRYDEAQEAYEAADRRSPGDPRYLSNLANCRRQLADYTEMYSLMASAVAAEPDNPRWSQTIVDAALALNSPSQAVTAARDGLARHPNHPGLNAGLCSGLVRSQLYVEAEVACVRAAGLAIGDLQPRRMLAVVYIETSRAVEAETVLREAIADGADDAYTWYNLGSALVGQNDPTGALAAFETAVARDPSLAIAHFMLGNVRSATGDSDGAGEAWCRASALDPSRARFAEACGEP